MKRRLRFWTEVLRAGSGWLRRVVGALLVAVALVGVLTHLVISGLAVGRSVLVLVLAALVIVAVGAAEGSFRVWDELRGRVKASEAAVLREVRPAHAQRLAELAQRIRDQVNNAQMPNLGDDTNAQAFRMHFPEITNAIEQLKAANAEVETKRQAFSRDIAQDTEARFPDTQGWFTKTIIHNAIWYLIEAQGVATTNEPPIDKIPGQGVVVWSNHPVYEGPEVPQKSPAVLKAWVDDKRSSELANSLVEAKAALADRLTELVAELDVVIQGATIHEAVGCRVCRTATSPLAA